MRKPRGFTLIELMIVVAIVAILALIAYPAYTAYVERARRADAQTALMQFSAAMERHYSENLSYAGAADASGVPTIFATQAPLDGGSKYYNLRVTAADATGYTLTAIPIGAQAGDGNLTLQGSGVRGWDKNNDGSLAASEQCWQRSCT